MGVSQEEGGVSRKPPQPSPPVLLLLWPEADRKETQQKSCTSRKRLGGFQVPRGATSGPRSLCCARSQLHSCRVGAWDLRVSVLSSSTFPGVEGAWGCSLDHFPSSSDPSGLWQGPGNAVVFKLSGWSQCDFRVEAHPSGKGKG